MTRSMIFQAYRLDMRSRNLAPRSLESYDRATQHFSQYLEAEGVRPEDATRPHIQLWLHSTGWAPTTQKVAFSWVRAAYSYAVDELELLPRNPCRRVRLARIPERVPRTVPVRVLRLLEAECATNDDLLFLRLFSYTGMRSVGVRRLSWNDVSFSENTLHVTEKRDAERLVPIHPRLRECLVAAERHSPWVLWSHKTRGPLSEDGLQHRLKRINHWGVQKHDFRRTVGTNLRQNGVDITVIKALLGHSRGGGEFERAYNDVPIAELQSAILRVYASDPI